MDFKVCTKCKENKPYSSFSPSKSTRIGLSSWCKACCAKETRRRSALPKTPLSLKKALIFQRRRRAALGAYVLDYLKVHPCVDCGETDPIVLDFDHVRGQKRYAVTYMISHQFGLRTVQEEIEKCEIRCANCHRRKTAREQNWSRLTNYEG